MDFSSVPVFFDPPTWYQGITNQPSSGLVPTDPLEILPPPAAGLNGGGSGLDPGLIRPGSMVDRARVARLPLPETGLKCPRCESTNTKFCYFNNYNLSQPRHFCKACHRYWTRGGALRNVPVGGGCRRNKRSKARSKTGSKTDPVWTQNIRRGGINNTTSQLLSSSDNNTSANDLSSQVILPPPRPDPFLSGLHHLNGFGSGGPAGEVEQLSSLLAGSGVTGSGLYPFDEISIPDHTKSGFGRVKVDENHLGLNLSKNSMLGVQGSSIGDQYSSWGGGITGWADISGFHGSSSYDGSIN